MKILVNGGLGNQLFQFAYAHRRTSKNGKIQLVRDSKPREDRPFELDALVKTCTHKSVIKVTAPIYLKYRLAVVRRLASHQLPTLAKVAQAIFRTNLEMMPFTYIDLMQDRMNSRTSAGYFQHWRFVDESWDTFGKDLTSTLSKVELPKFLDLAVKESLVVHVRQGDLNNVKESMGILSLEYYLDAIEFLRKKTGKHKTIILTDDVNGAMKTFLGQEIDKFVGPESLNAWETLKLMSISPNLITANSTLSWWGGYVAGKSGSNVVMPKPWFRNWHEEVGDAFYFDGVSVMSSKYQ